MKFSTTDSETLDSGPIYDVCPYANLGVPYLPITTWDTKSPISRLQHFRARHENRHMIFTAVIGTARNKSSADSCSKQACRSITVQILEVQVWPMGSQSYEVRISNLFLTLSRFPPPASSLLPWENTVALFRVPTELYATHMERCHTTTSAQQPSTSLDKKFPQQTSR